MIRPDDLNVDAISDQKAAIIIAAIYRHCSWAMASTVSMQVKSDMTPVGLIRTESFGKGELVALTPIEEGVFFSRCWHWCHNNAEMFLNQNH